MTTQQVNYSEQIAGLPAAETQTNNLYRVANSPGGNSAFVGTIATLPGGATLTYNITSGQEGAMAVSSTAALGKIRLYNTTRGTSALISQCTTATNTLTLTANVPAGWQTGDTITIASQTVSGGTIDWIDLEITSGPVGKTILFLWLSISSATVGNAAYVHPFETYAASKIFSISTQAAGTTALSMTLVAVTNNVISIAWVGTITAFLIQEAGYLD